MRKALLIIVTVILIRPVVPVLDYLIDYDYIATVLCINKDKPELACNGKCYLMKEMAKVAEDQSNDMAKKLCSLSFAFFYYTDDGEEIVFTKLSAYLKPVLGINVELKPELFTSSLFRPPHIV